MTPSRELVDAGREQIIADQNRTLAICDTTINNCLKALSWCHALTFENENGVPIGKEIATTLTLIRTVVILAE